MPARNSNINISAIYSRVMLLVLKPTIHLIPAKLIHICEVRSYHVFLLYTFSRRENYVLYKQGLRKCSSQSFSLRHELSKFRTRLLNLFQTVNT